MAAYPMPACGVSIDTEEYVIDDLKTIRMPASVYGVANGTPKRGYKLSHAMCTHAEKEAIIASYVTNRALSAGTITFTWPGDGSTKTTRWVGPPTVKPVSGFWWSVQSPLEE